MATPQDIRVRLDFADHPKLTDLDAYCGETRPGQSGCRCLLRLWSFCARHDKMRLDGVLRGLDAEAIERRAGWNGPAGRFFDALRATHLLDKKGAHFVLHDWIVHQEWIGVWEQRCKTAMKITRQREAERVRRQNEYLSSGAHKNGSVPANSGGSVNKASTSEASVVQPKTDSRATQTNSNQPSTTQLNTTQLNNIPSQLISTQLTTTHAGEGQPALVVNGGAFSKDLLNGEKSNGELRAWAALSNTLTAFGWAGAENRAALAFAQREFKYPDIDSIQFRRFVALGRYVIRAKKKSPLAYLTAALKNGLFEPADVDLDAAKQEFNAQVGAHL